MAYDIGERVNSRFLGRGLVIGDVFKDPEGDTLQRVRFDNPAIGERDYEVRRLAPAEDGGDVGA
jgi:hypothetical protein